MAEPAPERPAQQFPAATDPKGIRAGLPPENVAEFDADFTTSMATATDTLDLAPVMQCLEHWRRVAWMYSADPAGYRKMLDTAQALMDGQDVPIVSGTESMARINARLAADR